MQIELQRSVGMHVPTYLFGADGLSSHRYATNISPDKPEPLSFRKATVLNNNEQSWAAISHAVGEALLDVERTFMNVIERHSPDSNARLCHGSRQSLEDYMEAWAVLDQAHLRFVQLLVNRPGSLQRIMPDDDPRQ